MSEDRERDERTGRAAAAARIAQQQTWVDQQVRIAMERGDFDDLPGAGKPLADLGSGHDPDWWLKKLVERERLVVLPPSVQLRKEDAELDDRLDAIAAEREVRPGRGRGLQRPRDRGALPAARGPAADHHAPRRRGDRVGVAGAAYGARRASSYRCGGGAGTPTPLVATAGRREIGHTGG